MLKINRHMWTRWKCYQKKQNNHGFINGKLVIIDGQKNTKPRKWSFENIPCQKQSHCISIKCVEKSWKLHLIWKIAMTATKKITNNIEMINNIGKKFAWRFEHKNQNTNKNNWPLINIDSIQKQKLIRKKWSKSRQICPALVGSVFFADSYSTSINNWILILMLKSCFTGCHSSLFFLYLTQYPMIII